MQILEHILKIRREKEKHEFSQTVGNQLATIWHCEIFFSHCEICNVVFRIAKFAMWFSHCEISHCEIRSGFSHCEIRNVVFRIAKFAMWFSHCEISHCEIRSGFSHCEIRNVVFRIAKFAMWFSHCEIRCGFSHCEIRNTLRTVCELIAKIPTVLPSDFVLRITFSSELRFRRFWYRWKA